MILLHCDGCDGVRSRTLSGADKPESFVRRCLYRDLPASNVQCICNIPAHLVDIGTDARRFQNDGCIYVDDAAPVLQKETAHMPQEDETRDTLVAGISVREMFSDVPKRGRAKQRIGDGMKENVGIGMAFAAASASARKRRE